jgi:hypothetical protein
MHSNVCKQFLLVWTAWLYLHRITSDMRKIGRSMKLTAHIYVSADCKNSLSSCMSIVTTSLYGLVQKRTQRKLVFYCTSLRTLPQWYHLIFCLTFVFQFGTQVSELYNSWDVGQVDIAEWQRLFNFLRLTLTFQNTSSVMFRQRANLLLCSHSRNSETV